MTEETLSVSGILLSKTFGQQDNAVNRFRSINQVLAGLQIRQAMVGSLVLHDHRHDLQHHAGVRVLAGRLPRDQQRPVRADDRRHRRLHDAPEPALLPARAAAQRPGRDPGRAGALRPDLRVPRDGPRDRRCARRRGHGPRPDARQGRVPRCLVPLPDRGGPVQPGARRDGRCRAATPLRTHRPPNQPPEAIAEPASIPHRAPPDVRPRRHLVRGRAGRARRARRAVGIGQDDDHLPDPEALRRRSRRGRDRRRRRPPDQAHVARRHRRRGDPGDLPVPRVRARRTCCTPGPRRPTRSSRRPPGPRRSGTGSASCRRVWTRSSANVATSCRVARSSGSRSPGCCSRTPGS